jgi:hypothetical protein
MFHVNIVALKKVWFKTKNYILPPKNFLKIQPFFKNNWEFAIEYYFFFKI